MQLILEDGLIFKGKSFGYDKEIQGEVVFNTAMTGYVETLTDPSYKGQILVLTYPLQGNYGVPADDFESEEIQVEGLIVNHYSENPSHYLSELSLGGWLKKHKIPAMFGVDTRTLTRHLRHNGAIKGRMLFATSHNKKPPEVDMAKVIKMVAPEKIVKYKGGDKKILLIDTGAKENIVRSLLKRNATVIRTPWHADWEDLVDEIDGVFLTNGPGDPIDAGVGLIERIRKILNKDIPIFGICFGHQLLSLAAGGRTLKMKFGHRGVNQPVRDVFTNKCYITSQNHGYVVQSESLPKDWQTWFVNLNDGTNAGIRHATKPIYSVQFHPEARPGPNDTAFLFDNYMKTVSKLSKGKKTTKKIDKLPEAKI